MHTHAHRLTHTCNHILMNTHTDKSQSTKEKNSIYWEVNKQVTKICSTCSVMTTSKSPTVYIQCGNVLEFIVCIPAQILPRSKLGRKRFIQLTLPHCCSSPKEVRMELKQVRKQELMQRQWRDVPYWLASLGLLSLLSYRTQDYQSRDGTTHKGPFPLDH